MSERSTLDQWEAEAKSLLHDDCFYANSLSRQLTLIDLVRKKDEAMKKVNWSCVENHLKPFDILSKAIALTEQLGKETTDGY